MTPKRLPILQAAILTGFVLAGCSKSPTAPTSGAGLPNGARLALARATSLGTHEFVPRSDNPYFPLIPGTAYHYRSQTRDGVETEDFFVTERTKRIQGVSTIVVEDIVRLDGELTEHTFDWFAMDEFGDVWYFGEDAQSIDPETGEISTEGSWQAGRDGAEAGVIMEAHPQVGDTYNEENAPGVAEDQARVIALDARAKVPYGRFPHCLETENFTPLDPAALEDKYYVPGLGLVLEVDVVEKTRNELVNVTGPGAGRDRDGHDRGGRKGPRGVESD